MGTAKVAITLDENVLKRLDGLVNRHLFPNRSKAIQEAVEEKLNRLEHNRLARECAKLSPDFEKNMAEEGIAEDGVEWPEY
jgi:metal-responsive CopG/Arc/MetJ family transcriptional regulator